MPKKQTRNTVRVQVCVLPSELNEWRRIAQSRTEPGYEPNMSGAFREMLRVYLVAEEKGEVAAEIPGRKVRGKR